MTRHLSRVVGVVGVAWMLAQGPAIAQGQRSEADLLYAISQSPQQLGNYLDLARLLYDQGRLQEAEAVLGRAVTTVHEQRVGTAPATAANTGAPVRVGGGIKEPTKIKDVKPVYPADAEAAGIQGIVIVETTIGPSGLVSDARVLRSIPGLDQAAVDAVRQWEFTPTLLNGAPVPVIMTVTVNFRLR
ncbi:MAG TPA: TonB family protein [Vicinamibacterales bacterium]|nr:TonB family protein [Vicinamibacterales bacterium]